MCLAIIPTSKKHLTMLLKLGLSDKWASSQYIHLKFRVQEDAREKSGFRIAERIWLAGKQLKKCIISTGEEIVQKLPLYKVKKHLIAWNLKFRELHYIQQGKPFGNGEQRRATQGCLQLPILLYPCFCSPTFSPSHASLD